MTTRTQSCTFRVLDVLEGPHGGRILRLRLHSGEPPPVRSLKGARLQATSPDGSTKRYFRVEGFALFGGRPSDDRLIRSGRVDVHGTEEGDDPRISLRWEVSGPVAE